MKCHACDRRTTKGDTCDPCLAEKAAHEALNQFRYAIKADLGNGVLHHVDAGVYPGDVVDLAQRTYGYERLVVVDTFNQNRILWDSRELKH